MFGLDFSEILIIGVVALIVVGPKELPQLMRSIGRWIGKARRMASEFQVQMNEAIREAELEDVKKSVDDLRSLSPKAMLAEQFASVSRTLDEVKRETDATVASIGASVTAQPTVAEAATVEPPAVAEPRADTEVAARIDAATTAPMDLGAPVFDLTPAPGGPVETAAVISSAEAKKEPQA